MEVSARAGVWHGAGEPGAEHPVEADLGPSSDRITSCPALVSVLSRLF